jgi:hypothetical protein
MSDRRTGRTSIGYSAKHTVNGAIDQSLLNDEVVASSLIQKPTTVAVSVMMNSVQFEFDTDISESDLVILDQIVAAHQGGTAPLRMTKQKKVYSIDLKTSSLLLFGDFEYPVSSGLRFSMTSLSQFNTLVMYTRRNDNDFVYPVIRSTKDNSSSISLPDVNAVEAFYSSSETAVRSILDSGNVLKAQVNAATTVEQVNDIVDNR